MVRRKIEQDYRRLRAGEYPPITDLADAMVKDDQAQLDEYLAKCRAVKAKYPKPDGGNQSSPEG